MKHAARAPLVVLMSLVLGAARWYKSLLPLLTIVSPRMEWNYYRPPLNLHTRVDYSAEVGIFNIGVSQQWGAWMLFRWYYKRQWCFVLWSKQWWLHEVSIRVLFCLIECALFLFPIFYIGNLLFFNAKCLICGFQRKLSMTGTSLAKISSLKKITPSSARNWQDLTLSNFRKDQTPSYTLS